MSNRKVRGVLGYFQGSVLPAKLHKINNLVHTSPPHTWNRVLEQSHWVKGTSLVLLVSVARSASPVVYRRTDLPAQLLLRLLKFVLLTG